MVDRVPNPSKTDRLVGDVLGPLMESGPLAANREFVKLD